MTALYLFMHTIMATETTCPGLDKVISNNQWNLQSPGWTVALAMGAPGPNASFDDVAWVPTNGQNLFIQCWYLDWNTDATLTIYRVPYKNISARYINITSPISCDIVNGPTWSQFDLMSNKQRRQERRRKSEYQRNPYSNNDKLPIYTCNPPDGGDVTVCHWQSVANGDVISYPTCRDV